MHFWDFWEYVLAVYISFKLASFLLRTRIQSSPQHTASFTLCHCSFNSLCNAIKAEMTMEFLSWLSRATAHYGFK